MTQERSVNQMPRPPSEQGRLSITRGCGANDRGAAYRTSMQNHGMTLTTSSIPTVMRCGWLSPSSSSASPEMSTFFVGARAAVSAGNRLASGGNQYRASAIPPLISRLYAWVLALFPSSPRRRAGYRERKRFLFLVAAGGEWHRTPPGSIPGCGWRKRPSLCRTV